MCTPYGITVHTAKKRLKTGLVSNYIVGPTSADTLKDPNCEEDYAEAVERMSSNKEAAEDFDDVASVCAALFQPLISQALETTAPGVSRGMKILWEVIGKAEAPIHWTTPTGGGVSYNYPKVDRKITRYGPRRKHIISMPNVLWGTSDRSKNRNSSVANIIHSLDACLITNVVTK